MTLTRPLAAVLLVVLLALALGGQAVTDGLAVQDSADAGDVLGRAGFAYLTGFRTFAASVLWNRLGPQFHEYYGGTLDRSEYMVPTLRMVTWLDPQFTEAYFTGPWILQRRGMEEEAWEFAMEGVEKNPDSGLLIAQLAQLALIQDDVDRARGYALQALEDGTEWGSLVDKHDSYAILRDVFMTADDAENVALILRELDLIDAELESTLGASGLDAVHEGHDHDH